MICIRLLIFMSISTATIQAQISSELIFKNSNSKSKDRILVGESGNLDLQCYVKGSKDEKYKDQLVITANDTDPIVCSSAANSDSCKWIPGGDTEPYLLFRPTQTALYTCKCTKDCVIKDLKPSIMAYITTAKDRKAIMTCPDAKENEVNLFELRNLNRTTFTLSCNGTDLPLTWFRNGKELKNDSHYLLNGTELTVNFKVKNPPDINRYSGIFVCDAGGIAQGFMKAKADYWLRGTSKSRNYIEGETAVITCDIDGDLTPQVNWTRKKSPLPENRITYGFSGLSTAMLTISNLVMDDYDDYECKIIVDNNYTTPAIAVSTLLRIRSKLAPLWPFLGIVIELVLLAAIIIIHEKKCANKNEDDENDDGGDRKRSPNDSNNEDNGLRQRKS